MIAFEIFQIVFSICFALFSVVSGLYISWLISFRNLFTAMFVSPFVVIAWTFFLGRIIEPLGWLC